MKRARSPDSTLFRPALGCRGAVAWLLVLWALGATCAEAQSPAPSSSTPPSAANRAEQPGGFLGRTTPKPAEPPPSVNMTAAFVKMTVALLVVLALVVGLAYLLRRATARFRLGGGGVVTVLAQVPLGPSQFLSVVDIGGEILVLGVTEHSVTALSEIEDPAVVEQLRREVPLKGIRPGAVLSNVPPFRQWLHRAQQGELDGS